MRRLLKIALGLGLTAAVLFAAAALVLYRGTQHVPEFYAQTLTASFPAAQQTQVGDDFERQALELHNRSTKPGRWQAEFTDEQINAWLATILPRNHPRSLPAEIHDPRIKIADQEVQIAWRYQSGRFQTVMSFSSRVYLTDKPNQLALRLHGVRAGWVPLPLDRLLQRVSEAARQNGVDLLWSQEDGDPVAVIQVPTRLERYPGREIHLETLELQPGRLRLAGSTKRRVGGR
ncbi:MAG: hypothetical protein GX575_21265 [Candidatus Anammoximicrobium sp.]|nr:hypothetical protein [Candidatus Anammoximicrobium sp.]